MPKPIFFKKKKKRLVSANFVIFQNESGGLTQELQQQAEQEADEAMDGLDDEINDDTEI